MTSSLPLGPLMADVAGTALTPEDRQRLIHPLVGGVILFSRNYRDPEQLAALCRDIHSLRQPALLISIDHEGGRVQRCREGFTRLPPMAALGRYWEQNPGEALAGAEALGYVLAAELRAAGVDFSYAPVLDLNYGRSSVIGDRSLHRNPQAVTDLARALMQGMGAAGMANCGKHFPGHGWVAADSHVSIPVDERSLAELTEDMAPYQALVQEGCLKAVMPAHVTYPAMDGHPAGFSPYWIHKLRRELGFTGVIFSDDLSMAGAGVVGGIQQRAQAAWDAGCDVLLVCNQPASVDELLANWRVEVPEDKIQRLMGLQPQGEALSREQLKQEARYQEGVAWAERLGQE